MQRTLEVDSDFFFLAKDTGECQFFCVFDLMAHVAKRFELAVNVLLKQKNTDHNRERVLNNDLVLHD